MIEAGEAAAVRHGWETKPKFGLAGGIGDAASLERARAQGARVAGIGTLLIPAGKAVSAMECFDPLHGHMGGRFHGCLLEDGGWTVLDPDASAFFSWADSAGRTPGDALVALRNTLVAD
jgi:hypothetical protein